MSLTVPRAGTVAGRSADIRINQPQTGGIIADFGAVMAEVGTALEAERIDRTRARDRLGLTAAMEQLRLEADQIGDPDQLDTLWRQRTAAIRDNYLKTVDPKLASQAALEFDSLAQPHAFAVGRRQVQLMQDQRMATYTDQRAAILRQVQTVDPADAPGLFSRLDAEVDGLVARGIIPADRAAAEKQGYRSEAAGARATRLLDEDPAALVAGIDAGTFADLDPERAQSFRARGTSAVAAAAAREAQAAKAENAGRIAAARDLLKEGSAVYQKGRAFARQDEADALLQDPDIAALPEAEAYARSAFLHAEMPAFSALPLAEKQAMLAEVEAQPIGNPDAARVAEAMRENIDSHREAVRKDPWGYAASIGVVQAQPLPELSDPGFDAALRQRRIDLARLSGTGIAPDAPAVFTPDEAERLAPLAAPEASPAQRADLAARLAAHLEPEDMDRAADQLKADPVFGYVGTGLASGGLAPATARRIFEGQRAIASKDVSLPGPSEIREPWFETYADLFADGTGELGIDETGPRDRILAAAQALYAYEARRQVADTKDGKLSETIWQQALHEALGGTGKAGDPDATGGVAEIRGAKVLMPPNLTPRQVEGGLDTISNQIGGAPWSSPRQAPDAVLARLSPSGAVPRIGGQPMDAATWRRLRLKATDEGFAMVWQNPETGQERIVTDTGGAPWIIDPARLARLAR